MIDLIRMSFGMAEWKEQVSYFNSFVESLIRCCNTNSSISVVGPKGLENVEENSRYRMNGNKIEFA